MKKIIFGVILALAGSLAGMAKPLPVDCTIGAGYNIGATTPLGLPASIREIGGYSPGADFNVGVYASRMIADRWGIGLGVVYDRKGMQASITTRNYHLTMNITDGDEIGTKTGYYTGKIKNKTELGYLSVPVYAVFRPSDKWEFTGGVYFAAALSRSFIGNVSEGKMREDPLHPAIGITRAEYDYSSDIRKFDTGITIGANRRIYRGLGVKASMQWGLISVLDPSTRKIDMNTYNVYLNLGLTYAL